MLDWMNVHATSLVFGLVGGGGVFMYLLMCWLDRDADDFPTEPPRG